MTAAELRNSIIKKYKENQTISLTTTEDDRKVNSKMVVKIVKFYPHFVLVERHGFYEGYTYWDIYHMASTSKPKEIIIPERIKKRRNAG